MKKLFLITIILLLPSFPSFGEWKKIGDFDFGSNGGVIFIDVDTIRKKGDLIYYNILEDYYEPFGVDNELSQLSRHKMNCKTENHQRLRSVGYKNSMGKGEVTLEMVYRYTKMMPWIRIGPTETHYQYLCK